MNPVIALPAFLTQLGADSQPLAQGGRRGWPRPERWFRLAEDAF